MEIWKITRILETAARRAKISSISPQWDRKRVCATFGTFTSGQDRQNKL